MINQEWFVPKMFNTCGWETEIKIDCVCYTKDERDQEIEKEIFTDGFRYGTRRTFVLFDKTISTDVKYQSRRCVSMIGFSYADKILSSGFYRKFFDSSYFYAMRQSLFSWYSLWNDCRTRLWTEWSALIMILLFEE